MLYEVITDYVTRADGINYFQPFIHFPKASVMAVQVLCVFTVVANKKLRTTCISAGMRH